MAKPRYIICSLARIVDRETNLISHLNVVDELNITVAPGEQDRTSGFGVPPLCVSAVWMREGDDEATAEYETEFRIFAPGEDDPKLTQACNFQFTQRFYRIEFVFQSSDKAAVQIPLRQGMLRFESRIRQVGSPKWLSQEYLVPVNVHRLEEGPE